MIGDASEKGKSLGRLYPHGRLQSPPCRSLLRNFTMGAIGPIHIALLLFIFYCMILVLRNFGTGIHFDLGTPINTGLLLFIIYSIQKILFPSTSTPSTLPNEFQSGYSWAPKAHPPTLLFTTYTPKTLEPFHGKDSGRILLAIDGIVFDVTAGRSFYGPGRCSRLVTEFMNLM